MDVVEEDVVEEDVEEVRKDRICLELGERWEERAMREGERGFIRRSLESMLGGGGSLEEG